MCVVKLVSFPFQGFMQTLVYLITSNLRTCTRRFALICDCHNIQQMPQEKSMNSTFLTWFHVLPHIHTHKFDGKL